MKIITLFGKPHPLARPRFSNNKVYDSQKELNQSYILQIKSQYKGPILQGPLALYANFLFQEKPIGRTRKNTSIEPIERIQDQDSLKWVNLHAKPHLSVPDLSNLVKLIEDVCIGIIYDDDKSIVYINACKYYHHTSMTLFSVVPIKDLPWQDSLSIKLQSNVTS